MGLFFQEKIPTNGYFILPIRDHSQTLVRGGLMQKGGALKILEPEKGGPEKKNTNFTPEKWVYMIFHRVDAYFPCQKGGPEKFWGPKGGPWKFFALKFFCIRPPLTSVCERSLEKMHGSGGGGHLYFRLDIILVKGLSKHTLNTYFSGMKIDPKYAFFSICSSCPF